MREGLKHRHQAAVTQMSSIWRGWRQGKVPGSGGVWGVHQQMPRTGQMCPEQGAEDTPREASSPVEIQLACQVQSRPAAPTMEPRSLKVRRALASAGLRGASCYRDSNKAEGPNSAAEPV